MPVPVFVKILISIQCGAGTALAMSAMTPSLSQAGAIYATAVTLVLISSGVAYVLALELIRPEIAQRD
jgi:hypothetical protein